MESALALRYIGKRELNCDLPLQIRTGRVGGGDLLDFQHYDCGYEYANDINDGQAGGDDAVDQKLCGQIVRVEERIRAGRVHGLVLQVWYALLRIDEPYAGLRPEKTL